MRREFVTYKTLFLVIALAALLVCSSATLGTPLKHNYIVLPETTIVAGESVVLSVRLHNEAPLTKIEMPLLINPGDGIHIDSIGYQDGRLMSVTPRHISRETNQLTHTMSMTFEGMGDPPSFLPPGDGEIAKIYLHIGSSVLGDVAIDTTQFGGFAYQLLDTAGVDVEDYFVYGQLHVLAGRPIIHLDPTTFDFSCYVGSNPLPMNLNITNLGTDPLNWSITHKPSWLNLSAMSGAAPGMISLTPDVASYPAGVLVDSIAVTDNNAVVPTEWARVTVTITEEGDVTRCLRLHKGWNLVSWNVDTPDDDIETIIANIKGCIDVVLGFEQGAASYDPYLPQFSTLTALDHLHGYWFRMTCDTVLCVTGPKVSPRTPIDLEVNWNLVSYLPEDTDSTTHALLSILDGLVVALGFDNGGLVYDPTLPQFATLKTMKQGLGYWLKVSGSGMLRYEEAPLSPLFVDRGTMKAYPPAPGVIPTTEWIDLFGDGITLDGMLIPTGTVLAAYDEQGNLCGQAVAEPGGRIKFTPVYRDDNATSAVEGPEVGGAINLTINGTPVQQSYIFSGMGDRIRLTALTSLSKPPENLPRQFGLAQNYPNPFNPTTSIEVSLPTASKTTVEVFNVVGERISTLIDRFLPAGKYSISWDGTNASGKQVSSGLYFYRLKAGDFVDTKKMMLVK